MKPLLHYHAQPEVTMKRIPHTLAPALILTALPWLATGDAVAAVDFNQDIRPIFQKVCLECHGPEKQKGKLRLDSREAALKGGQDGAVIVPGNAAKSDLYRRVTLAPDHDDFMPTKGKPLTKTQLDALRDWITQGAPWPAEKPAAKSATPATDPTGPKLGAAELKAIAELAKRGVEAREIASGLNWRQANFRAAAGQVDARAFALLKDIPSLQELNLATTKVTDADLAQLRLLTNLLALHLEHTQVTDAGLENLKALRRLSYLNLFGTSVTDAGLRHLKTLTGLRHLYVAETKVTDAGVAELKQALPGVEVHRGWTLPPATPAAPEKPKP